MKDALAQILEVVTDPMLVLDGQVRVLYSNPSAQQRGLDQLAHPLLRAIMKALAQGEQSVTVEVADIRARVVQWGHVHIAVMHPAAEPTVGLPADSLLNVLRESVLDPLNRSVPQLEALCREAEDLPVEWQALKRQGDSLARTLGDLQHLLQLRGAAALSLQDRVDLPALIAQVLLDQGRAFPGRRFKLADHAGPVGAVYANREWLAYAVQSSLNQLAAHSVAGDQIEVELLQQGLFVSVRLRNLGRTQARERTWIETRAIPERHPDGDAMVLSAELTRHILMLHKGHLRIQDHGAGSEIFLDLPTGAPPDAATESLAGQMERYATDLARLFAARNKTGRAQGLAAERHTPAV